MTKKVNYLKEILTYLKLNYAPGANMDQHRKDITAQIARREGVLETTISNNYRRTSGFDGTEDFMDYANIWLSNGSSSLERKIISSLTKKDDIREMRSFFAQFRSRVTVIPAPATPPTPVTRTVIPRKTRGTKVSEIMDVLRDLDYRITKKSVKALEAMSVHRWDPVNNLPISVKNRRKVSIRVDDKIYVDIKEDYETRTVFLGAIESTDHLRIVDKLTKI